MNTAQLLIIGNGFDLHCGLKSSYKDFFQSTILDTIGGRYGLAQKKAEISGFWETLLYGYYKKFGNIDYNWCDIETIIKDTVFSIGCQYSGFAFNALASVKRVEDTYDAIKTLNDPIEKFLYNYCMSVFYSYIKKTYSDDELYSLLLDNILQELRKFERKFCKYIKDNIVNFDNEKKLNEQYIVNAVNLLNILTGFSNKNYETINDILERQE